MAEQIPFKIGDIRDFVPEKIKPWILVAFLIVYQLSGGIYLASVAEMTGALALMQEDIMMAGYASLVGMSLFFTVMYRIKFRFSIKTSLTVSAAGLIACNIVCANTKSLPLLVAASFVAGIFRMWGTFACNTTIQLWITPVRDMSVWFCWIYLIVQGMMQVSGLVTVYTSFATQWEYVHWLVIGLLLTVWITTFYIFKHYRSMPKLLLLGMDWLGALLWGVTAMSAVFILNYGDHYDWFNSTEIWMGTIFFLSSLGLNLWRASFIRHPFIANETWKARNVRITFFLYILIDIFVSPSHIFEHIFTESILGYNALHAIQTNWIVLLGIVAGAFFCYQAFALRKWTFKTMTLIAFSCLIGYLISMYFIIDYAIPKEMLYFPVLMRAFGYEIIAIVFITALSTAGLPFYNFFQSLTCQAFISACCGALLGEAFLTRLFKITTKKNLLSLSTTFDHVNSSTAEIPNNALFGALQEHAMMVSMKEIYGWLSIFGLLCLLIFFFHQSDLRPKSFHPKFSTIRKAIKHQLKIDNALKNE